MIINDVLGWKYVSFSSYDIVTTKIQNTSTKIEVKCILFPWCWWGKAFCTLIYFTLFLSLSIHSTDLNFTFFLFFSVDILLEYTPYVSILMLSKLMTNNIHIHIFLQFYIWKSVIFKGNEKLLIIFFFDFLSKWTM